MTGTVPVVDISPFITGAKAGRRAVVEQVRRACEDTGFFSIVGHGVPREAVERIRRDLADSFALPLEDKLAIKRPAQQISRGYNPMGDQAVGRTLGAATPPDLQESFGFGYCDVPGDDPYFHTEMGKIFFAPNLWPAVPANLKDTIVAYRQVMNELAGNVMHIFAAALDLDETFFDDKIDRAISVLRIVNYPAVDAPPLEGQWRAGAHSDYGTLTLLHIEDYPQGLQIETRDGEWVDVPAVPGGYLINIGDLMMRWTNDRWVSTKHRVVCPTSELADRARTSVAFFHQPNYDAVCETIPTCIAAGESARYEPITSGAHWLAKTMKAKA
jgi:isopenicillin N synthase-like dioxygenase